MAAKDEIETELGRNQAYVEGIRSLFVKYRLTGWQAGYERLERELADYDAWIRANAKKFDGVIDFDAAMAEPGKPTVMRLAEQIGDHLHPNDAGYARMAKTALPVVVGQGCR